MTEMTNNNWKDWNNNVNNKTIEFNNWKKYDLLI